MTSLIGLGSGPSSARSPEQIAAGLDPRFRGARLVAKGGSCLVFRATDRLRDDAAVALKVYRPPRGRTPSGGASRFLREAQALIGFEHPGIVKVYDVFEGDPTYFSMEFLESTSLRDLLATGTLLPTRQVLRLGIQVAEALGFAHKAGVIHRDLKPANVVLDERFDAKLIDFGFALVEDLTRLTATGRVLGTPLYMSPEQVLGQPLDRRSDIYSLGIVLFELLTGRTPFDHPDDHVTEAVPVLVGKGRMPPVLTGRTGLIARMLAKDPDQRPASMGAVAEELRGAVAQYLRAKSLGL